MIDEGVVPTLRFTKALMDVARALIDHHVVDPASEIYGLELAQETGYGAGTVYPILRRLEGAGWLLSREEAAGMLRSNPRPPRVYYRINPEHLGAIRQRLAEVDARRRMFGSSVTGGAPSPSITAEGMVPK
ncbi:MULTISPECIES: helix-turn-helix transcriptional regulator [unclassified Streptomyces]|uniref:PadR family transcriptional regulator n=1 Tax=unclassified Streptomyces TaxID=2593676 RepID=UPI002DDB16B4|nr:helix-turn-helix transcriptional regulator [Streptomyces sp. NBC_00243]WRZ17012.1 PadR family transcriptional regulator [Streptomyces sp. NBC_00243]WRZ25652.1 PadR family transcriptional regulator [Streptomyces sp. NBC_00243]